MKPLKLTQLEKCLPGGGTDVTALHTAQQTEAAPIGYRSRFLQPEQTSWLCAPKFRKVTSLKIIASLQKLKNSTNITGYIQTYHIYCVGFKKLSAEIKLIK